MKHKNLAAAAISAVLGLMSLALSAKESYIGTDSTIVVRDYIANMEYVNGVLERVNFEGGYIDMTGESPRYMYYVTDHLGNVRTVVDEDGNVCQVNHYYPYGDRFDDTRDMTVEESDNTRLFGGKEYSEDTGLHDFDARYDNTLFGRFTTLDPMAEKYYSVSPYAYCAGNPVNRVDPSGMTDYFNTYGQLIYQDGIDNGKIMVTNELTMRLAHELCDGSDMGEFNSLLESMASTFHAAVTTEIMSHENALRVYEHYNETGLPLRDITDRENSMGFDYRNPDDLCIAINVGRNTRQTIDEGNANHVYTFDNYHNIRNTLNGHEMEHYLEWKELGGTKGYSSRSVAEHELRAIYSQRKHPTWNLTTDEHKKSVERYEKRFKK